MACRLHEPLTVPDVIGQENMIRRTFFTLLLLAGFPVAAAAQWIEVRPEDGRYRVLMPGNPQRSTQSVTLPNGRPAQLFKVTFEVQGDAFGAVSYGGAFVDELVRGLGAEKLLEKARDHAAGTDSVMSDTPLTVAGHPAREYMLLTSRSGRVLCRSILVGNRLYHLSVAGHLVEMRKPETRRFLESFRLTTP